MYFTKCTSFLKKIEIGTKILISKDISKTLASTKGVVLQQGEEWRHFSSSSRLFYSLPNKFFEYFLGICYVLEPLLGTGSHFKMQFFPCGIR